MSRTLILLASLVVAAPATAATYAGKPASPAGEAKFVARDITWNLAGSTYQGRTDESRPQVLCQSLAKRAGRLESFTVNGKAFADAELAKCNAAAPAAPATAVAAAD